MYTDKELAHLHGMGYEFSDGMIHGRPSIQRFMAERRYRDLDYDRSFLFFIERGRYRIGVPHTAYIVAEYDVRLIYPWPNNDEPQPPHPGMCQMEAGRELGMLLGIPFNRETAHIILDCEVYSLIDDLKTYLDRPDLRIPYDVAHMSFSVLTLR